MTRYVSEMGFRAPKLAPKLAVEQSMASPMAGWRRVE